MIIILYITTIILFDEKPRRNKSLQRNGKKYGIKGGENNLR